jgi:ribosome biogenesis protein Nip4
MEKRALIEFIRTTKREVQEEQYRESNSIADRTKFESIYDALEQVEDKLIQEEVEGYVQSLEESAKALEVDARQIKETYNELNDLSEKIEKIGKGIATVIDVVAKGKGFL